MLIKKFHTYNYECMTAYKRIVCLCLGLVVMLVFDGICEFTMQPSQPFYQSLNKPYINTIAHMLFYFFISLLMSLLIGESILNKRFRDYFVYWISLFCLKILSNIFIFLLHNLFMAFALDFIITIICMNLLVLYTKNTRYLGFVMLLVTIWYIYDCLLSYLLLIMN